MCCRVHAHAMSNSFDAPANIRDWHSSIEVATNVGLTVAQLNATIGIPEHYFSRSHVQVRGMSLRAEGHDKKRVNQNSGVADTFQIPSAQPCQPDTHRTWFGGCSGRHQSTNQNLSSVHQSEVVQT